MRGQSFSSSKEFLAFHKPEERIAIDSKDLSAIVASRARQTASNTHRPRMQMRAKSGSSNSGRPTRVYSRTLQENGRKLGERVTSRCATMRPQDDEVDSLLHTARMCVISRSYTTVARIDAPARAPLSRKCVTHRARDKALSRRYAV